MKIFMVAVLAFLGMGISQSNAQETIPFGLKETTITGAIPYSVIGEYKARFNAFKGQVVLDEKSQMIQSVYLEIEANSIESNCPWCDKIVRSKRLLYTARYPAIIFKSDHIIHDKNGYKVKGVLEMHGIKKLMILPFKEMVTIDPKTGRKQFDLKGHWTLNRKDFNIIWNRVLDKGGILVGDNFTVDWGLRCAAFP